LGFYAVLTVSSIVTDILEETVGSIFKVKAVQGVGSSVTGYMMHQHVNSLDHAINVQVATEQ
jgi:hypothetical protein